MPTSLRSLPVLVVDGQTTGASPAHGHLLELGWVRARADAELDGLAPCSRLLALPQGAQIPRAVSRLTGIGPEHLSEAEPPERVWASLCEAVAEGPAVVVVHYARFELAFLRALKRACSPEDDEVLPWRSVCTHEIARRLWPELPRRGLRALAGYLGHGVDSLKRSAEHVRATALVWHHVVDRLASEHGVSTLEELEAWLARPAPKPTAKHAYPMDRSVRLALPDEPGVYRMRRKGGALLYVGKARSLRERVNGYFRQHRGVADRTLEMLTQAQHLDVTVTASALEAALLESDEIKSLAPPYNVMLRGGGRTVWHASSDLGSWGEAPTRRLRRGPFPTHGVLEAWGALARVGSEAVPAAVLAWLHGADEGPEPAVWAEGLELFAARWGPIGMGRRALARAGASVWRAWRQSQDEASELEPDEAEPTEPGDEERGWDPERVAGVLERIAGLGAHHLRRAAWITRLVDATVTWVRPDGRIRTLVLEAGRVVDRLDPAEPGAVPSPPGWARTPRRRRSSVDLATFDRLRVLTSELRRVLADDREAWIRLGPGRELDPARLRRALGWV